MAKFPARLPRSWEPSHHAPTYENIKTVTKDLEVRRDLGNRPIPPTGSCEEVLTARWYGNGRWITLFWKILLFQYYFNFEACSENMIKRLLSCGSWYTGSRAFKTKSQNRLFPLNNLDTPLSWCITSLSTPFYRFSTSPLANYCIAPKQTKHV